MGRKHFASALSVVPLVGLALISPSATLAQVQINQQFNSQGPAPQLGTALNIYSTDAGGGFGTAAGAIQAVVPDPLLGANTFFAGSPNGGIFVTNNGGSTWKPLTDNQASLSIASMALDPTDPTGKTLIAGIGITDNGQYNSFNTGYQGRGGLQTGLLYTTNGGASWTPLGATTLANQTVIGVAALGNTILAATFEPQSTGVTATAAGAAYGLYRSGDGGKAFSLVGASQGLTVPGPVSSLVTDPSNPSVVYAAVSAPSTKNATIFMSANGGQTWNQVFNQPSNTNQISITLSTGPNGSVAAGVVDDTTGKLTGIFVFKNNGGGWTQLNLTQAQLNLVNPGATGQAPVNFAIKIDPNNPNIVYFAGDAYGTGFSPFSVTAFRIDTSTPTPTMTNLTTLGSPPTYQNGNLVHPDARALVFDSSGRLILASDGGIYALPNPQSPGLGTWTGLNGNLNAYEAYQVAYDANSKRLLMASQDNGAAVQSGVNNTQFTSLLGGDGINAVINDRTLRANGLSALYATSQELGGKDTGQGPSRFILGPNGLITDTSGNPVQATLMCRVGNAGPFGVCGSVVSGTWFGSPLVLNKWSDPSQGSQIAMGGDHAYVAVDPLADPNTTNPINLTLTDVGAVGRNSTGNAQSITAMAYGAGDKTTALLVGAGDRTGSGTTGTLFLSTTAAQNSLNPLSYAGLTPTSVVFDSRTYQRFYVADSVNVWGTNNAGNLITNVGAGNLPAGFIRPTSVEFISSNGVNALLVGGLNNAANAQSPIVVASSNANGDMSKFTPFGTGLPNALVYQMVYNPAVDVLAASSIGRGVWTLYDVTSYFPQATVLQFGLANNGSEPDASYLTDGTDLNGTPFTRPLNKYGTGTLTIAGSATYTGGTTIFGGLLMLGNGGTSGSILGNVVFSPCIGTTNPLCDPNANANRGLAFNRSDTSAFGGAISGPGQVQQIGAGVTDLTAANTYTGPTFVTAGTLAVDGSITSQVFVNPAATLSGAGVVGTTAIAPGGALQPGAFSFVGGTPVALFGAPQPGYVGLGTLTVAGDLFFSPGSFYRPTTNSNTNVDGTATLAGTVMPLFLPGRVNKTTTILAAGNPLSTTFDALALPIQLSGSLGYTSNDVILNLTSQLANVPGLTPNEMAVGGGLDNAFNNNGGLPAFGSLYALSPAGVAVALNQLSGQSLASEQTVLTSQTLYSREAVLARLRQAGYASSAGTQAVLAYAGPDAISMDDTTDPGEPLAYTGSKKSATTSAFPLKASPAAAPYAPNSGVTFWAQGMGGWGKINGNSNAAGTTGNFAGVLSGADVRLANNWLVGFALGYTGSSTNVSALASSAQVDTGLVAGYAGTNFGAWNLRLGGTYAINSVYTTRLIAFPGFMDRDTARFNAGTGQVFGEVGFGTAIQSVAVEPFAGLAYVHLDTAGFTESGGASALSTSGASQDTGYSSLGVRAAAAYTLWNGMMLIPRASLAWQYAFGEINPATGLAFAGIPGSNFNVTGVPIARNAALIDVGADLRINPQAKVGLYYWGQQASTAHENGLRGTVTWMF